MHLTRFTDNALRCLILLGLEPERAVPVPEIAARMNMSYDHLVKIVQRLTALEYVETVRGRHGGVRLLVDPTTLTIGTLVRQTEENLTLVECFSGEGVLDDALAAFFKVLDRKTLEDVLKPRRALLNSMLPFEPSPQGSG
jgi:Rrf2 family nitric oxide-sensitive transcriptional repressor